MSKVTYNRSLHEYFIVMGRKVRRDSRENVAVMMLSTDEACYSKYTVSRMRYLLAGYNSDIRELILIIFISIT